MKCMDCEESLMPPARRAVTLEHATQLWEVLQVDNMEFTVDDTTYHFQVLVDEASGYGAANFFFSHPARESRCPSGMEVLQHLHQGWIQYFGYPRCIKLDKEVPIAANSWMNGQKLMELNLKESLPKHMDRLERSRGDWHFEEEVVGSTEIFISTARTGNMAMVAAHNTMSNIGGYSPMQWVFGRNPTDGDRLHDGPDLPYWAGMSSEEKMRQRLQLRLDAGQKHQEFTLNEKIKQANNTRMPNLVNYHPGDLVFYKRYQPPQDKQERSHIPWTFHGGVWLVGMVLRECWPWRPESPMMEMDDPQADCLDHCPWKTEAGDFTTTSLCFRTRTCRCRIFQLYLGYTMDVWRPDIADQQRRV